MTLLEAEQAVLALHTVLQLKLQQRRTREELVNQGIMPPLKSPAAFHEQRRSLERARTEDYLKRKIRSRPERSELVRMHILEETSAEPSLQAKQMKLKRARLADDLNEKISQRPGPMELVVKNILPVDTNLKEAIIDVDYPKLADHSSFDEDSSDALSPEQPASQESQASVPSPPDIRPSESVLPPIISPNRAFTCIPFAPECIEKSLPPECFSTATLTISNGLSSSACKSFPALVKQSQPKAIAEKTQRCKKAKEPKPKVKKLKYHQYIPPDQKQKGTPALDSSYAKLLQQQQLFLQLQILNQQQHQHYNYQTILPAPPKPLPDQQNNNSSSINNMRPTVCSPTLATPTVTRQNSSTVVTGKTGPLPHNLDDMKVAELKLELKQRGLPVSGTKIDLIERLKATQDSSLATAISAKNTPVQQTKQSEVPVFQSSCLGTAESIKFCSSSSTPPGSPCPSEVSMVSIDETSSTNDAFSDTVTSPVTQLILQISPAQVNETFSTDARDKDVMLREKDKQIEELTRRLKQKQELVERLRQQLDQEKRTQQYQSPEDQALIVAIKQEPVSFSFNSIIKKVSEPSNVVKKEPSKDATNCQQEPHIVLGSMSKVIEGKKDDSGGTRLVLTLTNAGSQLPDGNRQIMLQRVSTPSSSLNSNLSPKQEMLVNQCTLQKPALQIVPGTFLSFSPSNLQPLLNMNGFQKHPTDTIKNANVPIEKQNLVYNESPATPPPQPEPEPPPQSVFPTPPSPTWSKEPIGFDETLKQQPSNSEDARPANIQMEDFFDILLQNFDIPSEFKDYLVPCLKQTSPTPAVQTVPQIEMPPPPLSPDRSELGRLEDFLESSTGTPVLQGDQDGPTSVPLIDDLHSQMLSSLAILDHPVSPMDTSDLHFSPVGHSLGLDISEPPLDGMDWFELSEPPAMNLTPLSTTTPSVFSTDFLDSSDLQLHWDSCL
ncbi:hypothetical protein GDO86_007489 [Hymenochirus boettgeri]|uniref:SAP domain-containing protein n=1 Tax=Hymenochirus boettgeri TaxID=247094 RepID=A0A8T2ITW2_9PIPI|nr:hypothetical protein GDO86_007489 [Hymenochirus boettgeri]